MRIRIPSIGTGVVSGDHAFLELLAGTGISFSETEKTTNDDAASVTISASATAAITNDFLPEGTGLLGWTFDPAAAGGGGGAVTAGQVNLQKILVPKQVTVTNVICNVATGGSGLTSSQNFAGIYNSAGTKLAETADQTTAWGTSGTKTMALTSTPTIGGNPTDFIWVALLTNGTTPPQFTRGANTLMTNFGLTAANYRYANTGSGLTSLPASFTPSGLNTAGQLFWCGLS